MRELCDEMDLTSKYRTRHPPREHEEAVRMLLEGIANTSINNNNININSNSKQPSETNNMIKPNNSRDFVASDEASLSADTSSSVEEFAAPPPVQQTETTSVHSNSKATSTSDESATATTSSSSGIDRDGPMFREPVPSRTIAVQCDLKPSAYRRDDTSMQASSISSTRYGFYNYTPEVLANRLKLQRANNMGRSRSRSNLVAGGGGDRQQVEAPTSMSESSESSLSGGGRDGASDDEQATLRRRQRLSKRQATSQFDLDDARGEETRRQPTGAPLSQTARARINSMPRRPMTAMSYVSSARLRGDSATLNRPQSKLGAASRTMSQQTLVRSRTPAPEPASPSGSDSDLDEGQHFSPPPPRSQERRTSQMPLKPPRPTLHTSSSAHRRQAPNYRTLERMPAARDPSPAERGPRLVVGPTSVTRRTITSDLYQHQHQQQQQPTSRQEQNISRRPSTISRRSTASGLRENLAINGNENDDEDDDDETVIQMDSYASRAPVEEARFERAELQYPINSMSLSRRPKMMRTETMGEVTSNYGTTARKGRKLNRNDRTYSQTTLTKPSPIYASDMSSTANVATTRHVDDYEPTNVIRSTSMRHINRYDQRPTPKDNQQRQQNYLIAQEFKQQQQQQQKQLDEPSSLSMNQFNQRFDYDEDDSESSVSKTWLSPGLKTSNGLSATNQQNLSNPRKTAGLYSMRNNSNTADSYDDYSYRQTQQQQQQQQQQRAEISPYTSSSESVPETVQRQRQQEQARYVQRSYDSQERLNEIGLPEVNLAASRRQESSAHSYLGLSDHPSTRSSGTHHHGNTARTRSGQIIGRAMSQQSLTRPTMPLRRRGGTSNSGGSDVGGSSMSLVSRLQGRYENAHTRTPVVMYIPQVNATPRSSLLGSENRASTLRKSTRSRQKSSSADRSRRSLSRNGSDSESSSMLRTLVRTSRGSRIQSHYASKRSRTMADHHQDMDEDTDCVGQLASEKDSYKFRRRYSVPKDAKINWFSKLKHWGASSGSK